MQNFQILSCNGSLGTCCNDYGLVAILDIIRRFFDILQIIVPLLLLVWGTIQLIKLMVNPEDKKLPKGLTNKIIAAVMVFILPVIVDTVLGLFSTNESFQVAACWEQAKITSEITRTQQTTYVDQNDSRKASSILINPSSYETGTPPTSTGGTSSNPNYTGTVGNGTSTNLGQSIVAYANQFVGQRYVYGGSWNGEVPYTPTDCSGFVQGVFKHHGISLKRTTSTQWADKSKYTLVNPSDIRAGDLVMYDGHVGILTGNGTEFIHAKGSKWGVVKDPDYRKGSSHAILGIMRIKGV